MLVALIFILRKPISQALAARSSGISKTLASSSRAIESATGNLKQLENQVSSVEIEAKKNASPAASGLFLQVGAFANPDAAQLLKDKLSGVVSAPVFISSVVHNQQTLHRVRLGPIDTPDEALQLEQSVRLANLGQPRRVAVD